MASTIATNTDNPCVNCHKQRELIGGLKSELQSTKASLNALQTCEDLSKHFQALKAKRLKHYLTTTLSLLLSWTSRHQSVVKLMETSPQEVHSFMAILLEILESFASKQIPFDAKTIDIVCGICINVFSQPIVISDKIAIQDWNRWINCLLAVDTRLSLMALFNMSFNARALAVMCQRNGFMAQIAANVLRPDLQFDAKLKSVCLKLIHNLIVKTNDMNIRLQLYAELTRVLPITRIQEMVHQEPNPELRDDCALVLNSIGHSVKRPPKGHH